MKGLSAGLTFFNISTVTGVVLGLLAGGLGYHTALLSLCIGTCAGLIAYFSTVDPEAKPVVRETVKTDQKLSKRALRRLGKSAPATDGPSPWRYRSVWFWLLAGCFAIFAVRCFCWLLYIDGVDLKIQSVNNLGDLALHITYIKSFANGIALWPDNPIYVFSKLRYPAGVDLFNGLLCLVNVDLIKGLVWAGLLASLATCYAMYRWGGTFGVAGFLFNGGVVGFQALSTYQFLDYQGDKTIAWKSIPLTMFVTQRGLLYAVPAGLLLLWHWRQKFFPASTVAGVGDPGSSTADVADSPAAVTDPGYNRRGPLPFWVELSLYASMPLFHVHTFLALTVVLVCLFALESIREAEPLIKWIAISSIPDRPKWREVVGSLRIRKHALLLVGCAVIPATFFVWLITDHFNAGSVLEWFPGWVLSSKSNNDFKMPFFRFWFVNFGIWFPVIIVLVAFAVRNAWKNRAQLGNQLPVDLAFLIPACVIFLFGFLVKTAPWEWDNLKIMIWGYFIVLPFLWTDLIRPWPLPLRVAACIALFGSGFVSLFGGLVSPGYGFANRHELASVGNAIHNLPVEARFACYPTYNHPLLLQGRKVVLGYGGHLWTQGFHYHEADQKLRTLMLGQPNWQEAARFLKARYLFWGREEKTNYQTSTHPWEQLFPKVASGDWGEIYDLEPMAGSR